MVVKMSRLAGSSSTMSTVLGSNVFSWWSETKGSAERGPASPALKCSCTADRGPRGRNSCTGYVQPGRTHAFPATAGPMDTKAPEDDGSILEPNVDPTAHATPVAPGTPQPD